MTKARGQISFVDLNDGKSIMLSLDTNQSPTQIHNVDAPAYNAEHSYSDGDAGFEATYLPDYTKSPYLVITPVIFVSGETGNQIANIKATPYWTINGTPVNVYNNRNSRAQTSGSDNFPAAKVAFATSGSYTLTIKSNEYMVNGVLDIRCELDYHDSETGLDTTASARTSIQQLSVAMGTLSCAIYSKSGTKAFINKDIVSNSDIVLHADMYRGGHIDNTNVNYAWFRHDNPDDNSDDYNWYKIVTAVPSSDPTYNAEDASIVDPFLGKVGYYVIGSGSSANTLALNQAGNELTVKPDAVTNYDAFMCVCTDTDNQNSSTYGVSVGSIPIDVVDYTDPVTVEFYTPSGTMMTRGQDTLECYAQVFFNGKEFTQTQYNGTTFTWMKRDKDGNPAQGTATDNPSSASEHAAYMLDHKFIKSGSSLVVDETDVTNGRKAWHIVNNSYCRIAKGSTTEEGRKLVLYREEMAIKAIFTVEVDIDLT